MGMRRIVSNRWTNEMKLKSRTNLTVFDMRANSE